MSEIKLLNFKSIPDSPYYNNLASQLSISEFRPVDLSSVDFEFIRPLYAVLQIYNFLKLDSGEQFNYPNNIVNSYLFSLYKSLPGEPNQKMPFLNFTHQMFLGAKLLEKGNFPQVLSTMYPKATWIYPQLVDYPLRFDKITKNNQSGKTFWDESNSLPYFLTFAVDMHVHNNPSVHTLNKSAYKLVFLSRWSFEREDGLGGLPLMFNEDALGLDNQTWFRQNIDEYFNSERRKNVASTTGKPKAKKQEIVAAIDRVLSNINTIVPESASLENITTTI